MPNFQLNLTLFIRDQLDCLFKNALETVASKYLGHQKFRMWLRMVLI